jgi:hypothetical protein
LRRPFPKGKKGSDISDVLLPHLKKLPLERGVDTFLPTHGILLIRNQQNSKSYSGPVWLPNPES